MAFKIVRDTKIQWFQYRILTTNVFLKKKMKIKENDDCSFCNGYQETITHLLCECRKVNMIWNFVRAKICKRCKLTVDFTKDTILLGHSNKCINIVILFVKFYIYKSRCFVVKPSVQGLLSHLYDCYQTNRYIATLEQRSDRFEYDWKYVNMIIN